jgi:hypothetical protein
MPHSSSGSHVESSTTGCSATFAVATTATSAERTNPGPTPADRGARRRGLDGPAPRGGPYGPPDPRRVCRRPPPCGMCPANRCRGTGRHGRRGSPSPREGAGNHLVGKGVPRDERSGRTWASARGPAPDAHVPARVSRRGACRTTTRARPLKRRAPPPPAPDDRARRAEVSRCIRSRRRQPTPRCRLLSHTAPGHRDHRAWADLPTPRCRPRRTRRRGVAGGKLAGTRR